MIQPSINAVSKVVILRFRLSSFHCGASLLSNKNETKNYENLNCYAIKSPEISKIKQPYVFGISATGALGIERFVLPNGLPSLVKYLFLEKVGFSCTNGVYHPVHLNALNKNNLQPIDVACGYGFTVFSCKEKNKYHIYGCGINTDGQLGPISSSLKTTLKSGIPVTVVPVPNRINLNFTASEVQSFRPSHIACGRAHTLIACNQNFSPNEISSPIVYSLGNNVFGQCGREIISDECFGEMNAVITKVLLPKEIKSIKQVVCGQDHSILLSSDGKVYSCGLGSDGQVGLGSYGCIDKFTLVEGLLKDQFIIMVASRGDTTLALSSTNRLFAWGNNEYGQIWSNVAELQIPLPVELNLNKCIVPPICDLDHNTVHIGRIRSIACAGSMCSFVDDDGQVFVWGFGCLGIGPNTNFTPLPTLIPPGLFGSNSKNNSSKPVSVTSGLHHFIVQNSDGILWSWGAPRGGTYGLGLGNQVKNETKQTYPLSLLLPNKAVNIACGVDHTVILTKPFST